MKYSFSTKGWHNRSFTDFCEIAKKVGFNGIEPHNIKNSLFTDRDSAFSNNSVGKTQRMLFENKLSIPCIDAICDISDPELFDDAIAEIDRCFEIAINLGIPYIRVRAEKYDDVDVAMKNAKDIIWNYNLKAKSNKKQILVETAGLFEDTTLLRSLLEDCANDYIAALWTVSKAYFGAHESPARVIANLGGYVKHVHLYDANVNDGEVTPCIMGEGELPIEDVILALRSINYEGFISLVWEPSWCIEIQDIEVIFSQFIAFMRRYGDTSRHNSLFWNKTHTGTFPWEKETLIDLTFSQVLDKMVEEYPDQYAFRYTALDYTRTYEQFRDDVNQFARSLIRLGVKQGTHVAVWASNIPQWYIAFWATVKIGAVLVSVNTAYKIHEVEYLLKQSDTHTLIINEGNKESKYGEIIAELCPELKDVTKKHRLHAKRLPFLRNVITVGFEQTGCKTWDEVIELSNEVKQSEVDAMAAKVNKDDVCNMQYTSGTTGFPKGVMLTHYNVVNNGKCIGDRMDLSTADRMMIQVPMFHCFGMVLAMTASMTHGVTLSPIPYFSPKPALDCINREHITCFHGVPTMFISLLAHEDFEKTDFSYMRTGIMAGSPCPISAMKDVIEKMNMKEITIVYGQTEASPGCTMSSADDPIDVRVSTVGHNLPKIECKIVNPETGEECGIEENGEFLARGYNIMKGYYKMPNETAQAIDKDGWLHTGDLACKTAEGNYRITGRLKDMIIRGGENIYPKEIEEFIYTIPQVSDVQVIGIPDKRFGEEVMACVILKEGESLSEDEMRAIITKNLARHKVPRYIQFVDSFPMNAAGKILKYKMREDAVKKLGIESD